MNDTTKRQVKTINIHGNEYTPVSERVKSAHLLGKLESITTEVLSTDPVIVIKATVVDNGKTFTGISAANPLKAIEKQSPYEVAETSAVGRALGFAGYGIIDSIASADEVINAQGRVGQGTIRTDKPMSGSPKTNPIPVKCSVESCPNKCTEAVIDYCAKQLDCEPLCLIHQKDPKALKDFAKPGISDLDKGLEPSDENNGVADDPNYPPEPFASEDDFERSIN